MSRWALLWLPPAVLWNGIFLAQLTRKIMVEQDSSRLETIQLLCLEKMHFSVGTARLLSSCSHILDFALGRDTCYRPVISMFLPCKRPCRWRDSVKSCNKYTGGKPADLWVPLYTFVFLARQLAMQKSNQSRPIDNINDAFWLCVESCTCNSSSFLFQDGLVVVGLSTNCVPERSRNCVRSLGMKWTPVPTLAA